MNDLNLFQTAAMALLLTLFAIIPVGAYCAIVYSIIFSYCDKRPPFRRNFTRQVILLMLLHVALSLTVAWYLPGFNIRLTFTLLPVHSGLYIILSGFLMAHQRHVLKHEGDHGDLLRARMFLSIFIATYYSCLYGMVALGATSYTW